MANLLSVIKQCVKETVVAMVPSDNIIGTVVSIEPLRVRISEKITLERVNLIKLKSNYTLNSTVVLNRNHGGNRYVILGELIE